MELVITLRKKVEDTDQGLFLYNLVKERLNDHSEIKIAGHITNHYETKESE